MEFEFNVKNSNFDKLEKDNFSIDYEFLSGDVKIIDNLEVININFNIPLLDFVRGMTIIMSELKNKEKSTLEFDFTEGEGLLIFAKKANRLAIFLDFDGTSLDVEFDDFCKAIVKLNKKIKALVCQSIEISKFPELMSLFEDLNNRMKK